MKKKIFIIFFTLVLLPFTSYSQPTTVLISDGNVQTCNGILFDTGGQGAAGYQNNESFTLTICPDVPGDVVTVVFNNFNLSTTNTLPAPANNADNLSIYDGNSTGAPTLGTYTGNQLQGSIVSTTTGNATGCLTFVFTSNSAGTGVFSGTITCSTPCQPPTAQFTSPTVAQNPQKICVGESITFDASASTPQATFNIVDYIFDFGDGTVDTLQTPNTTHAFTNGPGEYLVTLNVIDDNGCINMNSEIIKVWVSTIPEFNTAISDSVICLGESSCLDGSFFNPVMYVPAPLSSLSGATYLPDDVGQCFTADLNFGFFTPGQTLNNINDLLGICVNMEHSYMGDLVATIICPNGTSVILHQQGGGGTNLGDPNQADDSLLIGTGWNYCWSPTATNGTWEDNSTIGATPNTMLNSTGSQSLVPGTYESVNPLNPLVGCPLNGIWQIEFCDLWGADDGFVFDFSVELDTSLYPSLTTFTPSIGQQGDSTYWTSTGVASTYITSTSNDSNIICITPTDTGSFNYTFNAYDDFGCSYDTTVTVTVVPGPTVNAGNDTTVCTGAIVQLNAQPINAAPEPCNYSIDMFDTFGDGWNGFEIEVVINGVSLGNFTFLNGTTNTSTFSVSNGDNITINTISGVFDGEVSYQILDCAGNVVFSDGINYTGNNPLIGNSIFNTTGSSPQIPYNYSWTPTTGLSNPGINNPTFTANANTTYIVEMWETNHQPCSSFDTINITAVPLGISPGTNGDTTLCRTYPAFDMFNVLNGTPAAGGIWIDAANNPISNIFDPEVDVSGDYTYYVGFGSCADSATVTIINPDSVLLTSRSPDTVVCVSGTASLYAAGSGGTGTLSLIWNNSLVGNGPHDVTPSDSTLYMVYVEDTLGCVSAIDTITVTLFDSIIIDPIPSDTVCSSSPGNTTTLTANAIGGHGNGFTYEWRDGSNNLIGNAQTVSINPVTSPETFTVYVGDDCSTPWDTMMVDIYWHPLLQPLFDTTIAGDYCLPVNVSFINTTDPLMVQSVTWDFGDGSALSTSTPNAAHSYANAGTYDVTLTVTSPEGCVEDTTAIGLVTAYSFPIADFTFSPDNPNTNNTEITFDNLSFGNDTNFWTFSYGNPNTSMNIDPVVVFPNDSPGVYPVELIVANAAGCRDTTTGRFVEIDGVYLFYIPNSFSPNNDGTNDMFRAYGVAIDLTHFSMQIFNRWGELVFETNDIEKGWDGTYKGKPVQTGTYIWKINAKEEYTPIVHKSSGHVTMIK